MCRPGNIQLDIFGLGFVGILRNLVMDEIEEYLGLIIS